MTKDKSKESVDSSNSNNEFVITVVSENSPGVLHRVTSVFTRRKINIESLCVAETGVKGISQFVICIRSNPELVQKLRYQILKIVEVIDSTVNLSSEVYCRETVFFSLKSCTDKQIIDINKKLSDFGATVVHTSSKKTIVEYSGDASEVDTIRKILESYGLFKLVRSGKFAIAS